MADGRVLEVITRPMTEGGRPIRNFYAVNVDSNDLAVQTLETHMAGKLKDEIVLVHTVFPEGTAKQARMNPGDVLFLFSTF
ncbi:hypothetical protein [Phenylobacterium sp.]|uniref:hypothetical protein n=1 Tax=Phenylobacterium sp. TaxID=1871053 RepID=UPI002D05554C|nr:hypothetical protein [Phenylobacterium sp.]HVI31614.1 hypothetical protein [Phenylobacterium sp.]